MRCLLIRHTVQDYSAWKAVFDEQADVRRANGSQGGRLFRSTESGEVLVLLEWDDLERARLFVDSDDLREGLIRSGVADRQTSGFWRTWSVQPSEEIPVGCLRWLHKRRIAMHRIPVIALIILMLAVPISGFAQSATPSASPSAASGDFSGLVDIGGRNLYLECRGEGSPTVILESGAGGRADVWSRDLQQPEGERTMVLPAVAEFTRVCAYDRPGTMGDVNPSLDPYGPLFYPSRSDPVPQPRTAQDMADDLHALVDAAAIPGPYVLVAHSAGGLVARLYASEYPNEVVGMVLLDSTHEDVWLRFQEALTPEQWEVFEAITVTNQDLLDAYPEAERWHTAPLADEATSAQVRQARKEAPLHPMPLVVLMHGIPFGDPFPAGRLPRWKPSCTTCRRIWPPSSPMPTLPLPPRAGTTSTRISRSW